MNSEVFNSLAIGNGDDHEERSSSHGDCSTKTVEKTNVRKTKDEKLVFYSRAVVLTVLMLTALVIAGMTYRIASQNERETFVHECSSNFPHGQPERGEHFLSIKTLSNLFPSAAHQADRDLPYVTVVDFEAFGEGTRQISKASVIAYSPVLRNQAELDEWSAYAANHTYIAEDRAHEVSLNVSTNGMDTHIERDDMVSNRVYKIAKDGRKVSEKGNGTFAPLWQTTPVLDDSRVNFNLASNPVFGEVLRHVLRSKVEVLSKLVDPHRLFGIPETDVNGTVDTSPSSLLVQPVLDKTALDNTQIVRAVVSAMIPWRDFFNNVLPDGHSGVFLVADTCGTNNTFIIHGAEAVFVGPGDLHDRQYNDMEEFFEFEFDTAQSDEGFYCHQHIHIFPTREYRHSFLTNAPILYSGIILVLFLFSAMVFVAYDWFVTNRQNITEQKANRTNAIVQELFPGDVATLLFTDPEDSGGANHPSPALNDFGKGERSTIAELHPEATVLFADIAGFTAWSSIREPGQVFTLLESVFQAFDVLAKKYRVFKVETIGDCYVAACGLPKPEAEHAVVMSRFARSIMLKFHQVCRDLELTLGPDTGDLALRVGMHSGPVTAGVLRGERARFQLFGDTVNTASRMESTGKRERVHISEQTAHQLTGHGRENWVVQREDMVEAKGKGLLVTFWLKLVGHEKAESVTTSDDVPRVERNDRGSFCEWNTDMLKVDGVDATKRNDRLIQWNTELLLGLLQKVVARRTALLECTVDTVTVVSAKELTDLAEEIGGDSIVADEVVDVIDMPNFVGTNSGATDVELGENVADQLLDFKIALMYNNNPFHNFEHASHVTMSVNKLLTRIVAPKFDVEMCADNQAALLHDHTCGITSDPLTQFAVVLSGLLHDLDHPGVNNSQLIVENPRMAKQYQEKSVAEQNSVDVAWSVLMDSDYDQLRAAIFATETELRRFRQLLVNSVIATDIFDKDQGTIRKNRWNKAFHETTPDDDAHEVKSRKATIVIEHLIQASDVAHTMQHWHVYQKWNQRLFDEMMMAYRAGRSDKDPSEGWYGGELWFFDNYVIPLTKKLKDCGVFGVSSDEYLNYAMHNRNEWQAKGKEVVQQYLHDFEAK